MTDGAGALLHCHWLQVMVLLGDNYFAERSVKQACHILTRRVARACSPPRAALACPDCCRLPVPAWA